MTNLALSPEEYRDIETLDLIRKRRAAGFPEEEIMRSVHAMSRDNARTPMQWTAGKNAGFTAGTPWLPVNPNHGEINAESQVGDPDSVFSCYRRLIRLRKERPILRDGFFRLLLPEDESIFAYTREDGEGTLLVVCNFTGESLPCPAGLPVPGPGAEVLAENYPDRGDTLRPYEARMTYWKESGEEN